jgi:MOSC domain-containing protein YiiM
MKTVVRLNNNNAGIYGTVVRTGTIHVGDPVSVVPAHPDEGTTDIPMGKADH